MTELTYGTNTGYQAYVAAARAADDAAHTAFERLYQSSPIEPRTMYGTVEGNRDLMRMHRNAQAQANSARAATDAIRRVSYAPIFSRLVDRPKPPQPKGSLREAA